MVRGLDSFLSGLIPRFPTYDTSKTEGAPFLSRRASRRPCSGEKSPLILAVDSSCPFFSSIALSKRTGSVVPGFPEISEKASLEWKWKWYPWNSPGLDPAVAHGMKPCGWLRNP